MRIALLWLSLAALAAAQPASDLLQTGIFEQETAGDLDGAIRIYRQILSSSADMRLYAPQAQYRLGVCLLRKGDNAGATEAFAALSRNYPEARDLIARARESMTDRGGLLPAPWSDTEVAEYRWNIPNVDDGWSLTRIAPAVGGKNLRIQINFYSPRLYTTIVDVEPAEMRPVEATYRPPNDGSQGRKRAMRRDAAAGPYEYGELLFLLRRMPLYVGWAQSIPVLGPAGRRAELNASVTGQESITVPAGTFQCFKVVLAINPESPSAPYTAPGNDWPADSTPQVLWYGVDGARPLVKMQAAGHTGELASLRTGEQMGTSSYRDPVIGYSFSVPAGWVYHSRAAFNGPATSVDLLDPEFQVRVTISGKSQKTPKESIHDILVAGAVQAQQTSGTGLVTSSPFQSGKVGDHESLTWVAEQNGPDDHTIRYTTWVQSEATRASIVAIVPAGNFSRFQSRFQAILNSFRMP